MRKDYERICWTQSKNMAYLMDDDTELKKLKEQKSV